MLSTSIKDGDQIGQSLDTDEKLQLVRQMTQLVNHSNYILLQKDLWDTYYELGMKCDKWPTRISKQSAREHNTCQMIGQPQHFVEQRRKIIERQLQQSGIELQHYFVKFSSWAQRYGPLIDINLLSEAINKCVENGQKRLRDAFQYKKTMLQNDYEDHQTINRFYISEANEEQVCERSKNS